MRAKYNQLQYTPVMDQSNVHNVQSLQQILSGKQQQNLINQNQNTQNCTSYSNAQQNLNNATAANTKLKNEESSINQQIQQNQLKTQALNAYLNDFQDNEVEVVNFLTLVGENSILNN